MEINILDCQLSNCDYSMVQYYVLGMSIYLYIFCFKRKLRPNRLQQPGSSKWPEMILQMEVTSTLKFDHL